MPQTATGWHKYFCLYRLKWTKAISRLDWDGNRNSSIIIFLDKTVWFKVPTSMNQTKKLTLVENLLLALRFFLSLALTTEKVDIKGGGIKIQLTRMLPFFKGNLEVTFMNDTIT